jgi:hypothetical protein
MKRRLVAAVLAVAGLAAVMSAPAAAGAAVPVPAVSGPIPVTSTSYPYLATDIDLSKYGYVEEEYFIDGNAFRYDITPTADPSVTGTKITTGGPNNDGAYPFRTRIVVRRPANPANANGTVLAEWYNVTAFQDVEWNWFGDPEFMLKNGYTFVGISAQDTGVARLKGFNNGRYGSLNVLWNPALAGGTDPTKDDLSYDIFGAAVNAIKGNRTGENPMGGINVQTVIASGESQSCGRLSTHYNKIEPLQNIVDAYLLTVCTSRLRADRPEKAVRIITETENRTQRSTTDFPDTNSLRHWEVAGASHLPRLAWDNAAAVLNRDFTLPITVSCQKFPLSLVQWPYTVNRAIKGLETWVESGTAPPIAPRGEYVDPTTLVRDQYGIAQGGIRFPELTVPTATNDGVNSPTPGGSIFSNFCGLLGSNTLFDRGLLDSLYVDYSDYINKYAAATDQFAQTGFILPEDVEKLKAFSRNFPELQPTAPMMAGSKVVRKSFGLTWVGTEAPDTTFKLERMSSKKGAGWAPVKATIKDRTATLKREPEGTFRYRVQSSTVIPANNIAEARTTTTPFSDESVKIKVDKTGPKAPRVVVTGRKAGRNAYTGPVRVRVIGLPDPKLPDGSAGSGLNRKSVPKTITVGKTRTLRITTLDKAGNRSKPTRVRIVIR